MAKPSPSHGKCKELVLLGKAIRKLRLEASLSQENFADEAGLDRSYLGGIERGEHNPALINLLKIAKTLNIDTSQLLASAKL